MRKCTLLLLSLCFVGTFSSFGSAFSPLPVIFYADFVAITDSTDSVGVAAADTLLTEEGTEARSAEAEAATHDRFSRYLPTYEQQLDSIRRIVPLDYNEYVRHHIELYTYRRRGLVSRMMGLSEYYFPIFEQALKERGLPLELKYLSIVESALNPTAVSRVGATGLWQFMYTTAREYDLQINSYIDERRDPVAASRAAAEYLSNMYGRYGDWLLAIASYNCGPGNVDRAIRKAGGKLDFWAIRPYLPGETRNYVPAYIAVTYIMNFATYHEIYPDPPAIALEPVPVQVEKHISLSSLSRALDMDVQQMYLMNPKYRRRIVNGSGARPQIVWLPPVKAEQYAGMRGKGGDDAKAIAVAEVEEAPEPVVYRVRKGDNLSSIANRFRCSVQDLKVWNDLRSTRLMPGQKLHIEAPGEATGSGALIAATYRVQRGDTLSSIAARFNTSVALLKELNGISRASSLRAGSVIRINPEG